MNPQLTKILHFSVWVKFDLFDDCGRLLICGRLYNNIIKYEQSVLGFGDYPQGVTNDT
jgi:hypothetical protein